MHGSIIIAFIIRSLTLLAVDNKVVAGCSMPAHHAPRTFRARAYAAEIVVFATVLQSPARSSHSVRKYYSAKLAIHCILKGPELPKVLIVSGFGNDGGGCSTTDAVQHKSYIILLKKFFGRYVVHKVDIARASKQAREKLLLKLLPDFWNKAHRPYSSLSKKSKYNHCPSFKRMKRLLRKSVRQYIRSQPKLSQKKQQLKQWLKKQRKLRKAAKMALKGTTELITVSTTLSNYVEKSLQLKANKKLDRRASLGVRKERSGLFKRSNSQFEMNKANYRNALSTGKALSTNLWLICFAWLMLGFICSWTSSCFTEIIIRSR